MTPLASFDEVMRMGLIDFTCPRCRAAVGAPCLSPKGDEVAPHKARVDAFWNAARAAKAREDAR